MSDRDDWQSRPLTDRIERLDAMWPEIEASVVRLLRAELKSLDEAREATQEAYLRIRNCRDPEAIRNPEGFVYTVARHISENRLRNRRLHLRLNLRFVIERDLQKGREDERSPERAYAAQQALAWVVRTLEQLPAPIKTAYEAHLAGEAVKSIAARLGIQLHTVYRYLRYVHERLAEARPMRGERDHE